MTKTEQFAAARRRIEMLRDGFGPGDGSIMLEQIDALEAQLTHANERIRKLREGIRSADFQSTAPNVFRVLDALLATDAKEGEGEVSEVKARRGSGRKTLKRGPIKEIPTR